MLRNKCMEQEKTLLRPMTRTTHSSCVALPPFHHTKRGRKGTDPTRWLCMVITYVDSR